MNKYPIEQQLLFIKDVEKITGCNRMTLRRWWIAGNFPKPVKLNGSVLAWHYDIIEQWINDNTKQIFNPLM
ncbi:helix-turn-helix transcriptional regulator [Legionella spiritensis]|uniref:helix-turn-helix transcriptional regulator n=1 Tax=Legionella spiritensis TaxID=452 RepID=UPI000F71CFD7|nr:AlpA family phage regulatory protein [Legionella spiritensis]VEG89603.1 prophage regulatory protein-like protein [Legionella spiritensis]VEG92585.1 prophage regulatory protein-like protein [Legionella spiritensis]